MRAVGESPAGIRLAIIVALAAPLLACVSQESRAAAAFLLGLPPPMAGSVKQKAAVDLACPAARVGVYEIKPFRYRALGCEKWAEYSCVVGQYGSFACFKETP